LPTPSAKTAGSDFSQQILPEDGSKSGQKRKLRSGASKNRHQNFNRY